MYSSLYILPLPTIFRAGFHYFLTLLSMLFTTSPTFPTSHHFSLHIATRISSLILPLITDKFALCVVSGIFFLEICKCNAAARVRVGQCTQELLEIKQSLST